MIDLFHVMFGGYGAGALAALLSRTSRPVALGLGHLGLFVGALSGAIGATAVLLGWAPPAQVTLPALFPFGRMTLELGGLGAYFVLVVSVVAAAAAVYGPAYLRAHPSGPAGLQVLGLNAFVGSMIAVCCATDVLTFLLAWEGMTLASYALVVSEGGDEQAHAGLLYIVMAHAGTAALLAVFLVLAERAGSLEFEALRTAARGLSAGGRTALFFLALTGLAAKAGVVPLHVWLPHAHPAAPSHVSALMSGVMLKVAIYGMLRFGFDLLAPAAGPLPASWGWTVLLLGTVSAVLGVLYALQQHDLKRLLAFHSVENVGIILMGVGLAMVLAHRGAAADRLATLALAAALLHTLNHAAFKGLLFLGAGSVLAATHVRNMEELGGLARRMPWTAWLFLLGAVAISALPPLNGFVSEWMTFQALVLGGALLEGGAGLSAVVAASMLALTGGLAAACFAKAFGVTFLGRPRSEHAAHARESAPTMIAGMVLLAAACVALGILPGHALRLLDPVTRDLVGDLGASAVVTARGPLVMSSGGGEAAVGTSVSVTLVAGLLGVLVLVVWAVRAWPRAAGRRLAPTWTCGMTPESRFDYTATGFAKPLRLIFAKVYRPHRQVESEASSSPYVLRSMRYQGDVTDLAETALYHRLQRWITDLAQAVRRRSTGRIHGYIAYVLVTLLVTLLLFGSTG